MRNTRPQKKGRISYGILLACGALALASYLLWREYRVGAFILATLGLAGLIGYLLARHAGNPQDAAVSGAGTGSDELKKNPLISVIICSIDSGKYDAVCANLRERLVDVTYEIIGIHDAKSLSEGYNRGIDRSQGDILIFCHDDIEIISPSFSSLLREHLLTFDVIGCAGTVRLTDSKWVSSGDPYVHGVVACPVGRTWPAERFDVWLWGGVELTQIADIQALDGFFMAARRHVVDSVRFDEKLFDGFHLYDTDFSYAAFSRGFELAVCKDILIAHQSGGNFGDVYKTYADRFREKYKESLSWNTEVGTCIHTKYQNVNRDQMLKAWF
jgi:GT2 family glycosyltransferase